MLQICFNYTDWSPNALGNRGLILINIKLNQKTLIGRTILTEADCKGDLRNYFMNTYIVKNSRGMIIGFAALLVFWSASVFGEAPSVLTYQGRLKEAGQPASGTRTVQIRLCADSGGAACFNTVPVAQIVSVSNGLFKSTFTVPSSINMTTGVWYLEVNVGGNVYLPREQLTSVPYAIYAASASALTAAPNQSGVVVSTNLIITGGNVGVGTTAPAYQLVISSGAGESGNMLVISTGSSNVIRMTGAGGIYASVFYGDGSALTGVQPIGDSLGNHVATTTLNMAGFDIVSAGGITANGEITTSSSMTVASGLGISAKQIRFAPNVSVSSEASAALGGGVRVSSNVYIVGFSSAARYYGDGSALTGVSGSDNLGNHTVSQNLLTGTFWISGDGADEGIYVGGAGNVGVGTSSPGSRLEINDSDANIATSGLKFTNFACSGTDKLTADAGGNVICSPDQTGGGSGNLIDNLFDTLGSGSDAGGRGMSDVGNSAFGLASASTRLDVQAAGGDAYAQFWRDSSGVIQASMTASGVLYADASQLRNVQSVMDDLGNHVATTTLNMAGFDIVNAGGITANGEITTSSSMTVASGLGISAKQIRFAPNVEVSSETSAALGGGVRVSSNVYIVGFSSAARYYGDGSALTGVGGSDNLGNHTATQQLVMGNYSIISSSDITAARYQIGGSTALAVLSGAGSFAVGMDLSTGSTGDYDLFVGYGAGRSNVAGEGNSFLGNGAGYSNNTGNNNSFLGAGAGYNNTMGTGNSFLGTLAGYSNTTGGNNSFLGSQAGFSVTTGTGNIVIGYGKDTSAPGASNELNIGDVLYGNLSAKTIGISTRVPQAALDIVSTGTAANQYAQIWRNSAGTIVSSMTATGVLYPSISVSGDNLGNHTATQQLVMGNYSIISSSDITAARYQIGGSTVLAVLSGAGSFAVGMDLSTGSAGDNDLFVGYGAGRSNVAGEGNTFLGAEAGYNNSAGNYNSFIGAGAGWSNIEGDYNSFLGSQAGSGVTTGAGNIVIGYAKDTSAPDASNELNIGDVLYGNLSAKTIGISTRVPQAALDIVSTGTAANQYAQIWRNSAGTIVSSMTATGVLYPSAGVGGDNLGNHTATQQLVMGNYSIISSSNITAARYQIGGSTVLAVLSGAGSFAVGMDLSTGSAGDNDLFVGYSAGRNNNSGASNSFLGAYAGYFNTAGGSNSFLGYAAGYNNTTGNSNSFLGYAAGYNNTTGLDNSFLGYQTGYNNTTGNYNTFLGYAAGQYNSTGSDNSFLGYQSGYNNITGSNNSFLGHQAGYSNLTGNNNAYLGYYAGNYNQTGSANTIFGNEAGKGLSGQSFSSSTLIGYHAGFALTTGSDNILLGFNAGYNITSGTGNIIIGYNGAAPAANTSNFLNMGGLIYGNLVAGKVGIGTTAPDYQLVATKGGNTFKWVDSGPYLLVTDGTRQIAMGADSGSKGWLGTISNDALGFRTNNTVKMSIDTSGNVGIGTTAPQATLDVNGTARLAKNAAQPYACDAAHDGAIALTSGYRLCACKGGTTSWVFTSDGATGCGW